MQGSDRPAACSSAALGSLHMQRPKTMPLHAWACHANISTLLSTKWHYSRHQLSIASSYMHMSQVQALHSLTHLMRRHRNLGLSLSRWGIRLRSQPF